MSTLLAPTYLTPCEEYLAWERKQPFKNEYHNGQIIAMSGASRWHNRITVDTTVQLSNQLMESECEVLKISSNLARRAYGQVRRSLTSIQMSSLSVVNRFLRMTPLIHSSIRLLS